jgi:hypothetical protein
MARLIYGVTESTKSFARNTQSPAMNVEWRKALFSECNHMQIRRIVLRICMSFKDEMRHYHGS